jgi:hypothetical protein
MEHEEEEDDVDVEQRIDQALNTIDPTGELTEGTKSERLAHAITEADEFAAGMFHGGRSAQEVMVFGMRMFMLGNLIHVQNCMKALKYKPPKNPEEEDHRSYQ